MTFRQRLIIAFTMVLVLPTLLFMVSFIVIGNLMVRENSGDSALEYLDYTSLTDDYRQYSGLLDGTYDQIRADIESGFAVVDQVPDLGGVRKLCQKASGLQFLVNFHVLFHFVWFSCLYILDQYLSTPERMEAARC